VPDDSARRDKGLSGFYAVLDRDDPGLAEQLLVSARVLQVRLKPATSAAVLAAARHVREITRRCGALLIINDRLDLALAAEADGVHLGQDDLPLAAARALVPPGFVIGISTHDLTQVRAAVAGGADYLGYGPVYPTITKENPDPVQGIQALAAAVTVAGRTPVVAIGGITPENVAAVAATGAAAACAISAVNRSADVVASGRAIARAWERAE